jgi:MinD-like ATPase involved in chromosome partitioning or flagellar assembly
MRVFDHVFDNTEKVIKSWNAFPQVREVTIIRDVYGRIALLLDMDGAVSETDKAQVKSALELALKNYFQGKIHYKTECTSDLLKAMVDEIEKLRGPSHEDGKWYVLERAIAKQAWIDCRLDEPAIWPYEEAVRGAKPKVVTFYSFKGGMGRTTALAATALCLAQQGKNVLMIDTDVEAPGLASLFVDESAINSGVVDYLLEYNLNQESVNMEDYLLQITDPALMADVQGQLFLIPAGVVDMYYLQKLARIDFQDSLPGSLKKRICQLIIDAVAKIGSACKVDYVLLDARAGFHDMGGIVTTQIPHGAVVFGKDSRQSWQGIKLAVQAISSVQNDRPMLAIVDSACGQNGVIQADEKQKFTRESHTICSEYYYEVDNQPGIEAQGEAHSPLFIPYQVALSGGFSLYSTGTNQENEQLEQMRSILTGKEYQQIAERILEWFNEGAQVDG